MKQLRSLSAHQRPHSYCAYLFAPIIKPFPYVLHVRDVKHKGMPLNPVNSISNMETSLGFSFENLGDTMHLVLPTTPTPRQRKLDKHHRHTAPPRTLYNFDPCPRYGGGFYRGTVTSNTHGANPVLYVLWDGDTAQTVACHLDITPIWERNPQCQHTKT